MGKKELNPDASLSGELFTDEREVIQALLKQANANATSDLIYHEIDLKRWPLGVELLAGTPTQSRAFVMASLQVLLECDIHLDQIQHRAASEAERANPLFIPGWRWTLFDRRLLQTLISQLLRRKLPLKEADLLALVSWCNSAVRLSSFHFPVSGICRALQQFAHSNPIGTELQSAIQTFWRHLDASRDKSAKQAASLLARLGIGEDTASEEQSDHVYRDTPVPGPVGHADALIQLKQLFRIPASEQTTDVTILPPDLFPLHGDSPFLREHQQLSLVFSEVGGTPQYSAPILQHIESAAPILETKGPDRSKFVLAAAERYVQALTARSPNSEDFRIWQARYTAICMPWRSLFENVEFDRQTTFDLVLLLSIFGPHLRAQLPGEEHRLIDEAERHSQAAELTEGERYVLALFRASFISSPPLGTTPDEVVRLTRLIDDGAAFVLVPGEHWSDTINTELSRLDRGKRKQWIELFQHLITATSSRPSDKWLRTASKLIDAIGTDNFSETISRWLPLVSRGQSAPRMGHYYGDTRGAGDTIQEGNATCLRGMLWCIPLLTRRDELTRAISSVALSAYKKVPGVGARAVKVGNGAICALSELATKDAVGQLAMLKVRVKFGTAQKEIEKAFDAAATALQLPRDQIEELGVPSYGLEEVGRRRETLGDYVGEITVTGSSAELKWFDANGKSLKSVPAKVKSDHKEELKELQQSVKDIQSMLVAQRDRIDSLFLLQKSWPISEWKERYLDHPLVGTIAQRLIWCVDGTAVFFIDGQPTDAMGKLIEHGATAEITLWHPVGRPIEEITAWRQRLEELKVTQPFKQAYRELYLLTDAERNTRTYSNRFAAHIIRQHQFNALCAARGWKNRLRLMVDDSYPPATKDLPEWGLRAEYWIEGVGQDYGVDTNDSGVYLRLATDQVRFYRTGAAGNFAHAGGGGYTTAAAGAGANNVNEPLPLTEVPELVFSEVMRDVDLFVGVASVGNDPTWQDGGPDGRYQTYWHSYSFGELSGSAATRKQVLERLVPRLKIAKQCSFSERFLVVKGSLRTYKIHLGSGNILMEPNDEYLCIVPDAKARASENDLYLPFEGDSTLSIILSKAFLLADDTKIKDPTITRQIKRI